MPSASQIQTSDFLGFYRSIFRILSGPPDNIKVFQGNAKSNAELRDFSRQQKPCMNSHMHSSSSLPTNNSGAYGKHLNSGVN